uniref:Zona pellucida sperm-binding protein 4 n=1 Tax=Amphiprion percula TaxID=161767 RepID=A0A3P8SAW6_AMPPE
MAQSWGATSLVALALLYCLVGTEVEAQDSQWQQHAAPMAQGGTLPQTLQRSSLLHHILHILKRHKSSLIHHLLHTLKHHRSSLPHQRLLHTLKRHRSSLLHHVLHILKRHKSSLIHHLLHTLKQHRSSLPHQRLLHTLKRHRSSLLHHILHILKRHKSSLIHHLLHTLKQHRSSLPHQRLLHTLKRHRSSLLHHILHILKLITRYPQTLPALQSSQNPQAPQPHPQKLQQTTFQSCEVAQSQRIPCGGSDISAAACESISCCSDGRQCYFGKAVTVQCTKDAKFIVVVAKDATLPNIDLEAISLLGGGQGCTHVDSNSQFAIYQFPVTACGSLVKEEPGVIIYENKMTCAYEVGVGPLGATTRDRHYEVLFQCRYIGTSVETLVVEVLPLQNPPLPVAGLGPISVKLRLANGQCSSKGCNEVDVAYSSFYSEADYPVRKVLRDPVYVDVQLLGKTDPLLVLTLGRCWATTSPEPHSLPQWDILIDGCPYRDDRYLSSLVPVDHASGFPSHHKHFIFKMFTFLDPSSMATQREMVYIHCSTAVCYAAPGTRCEPVCYRRKRDVKAVSQEKSEQRVVVSSGPVAMVSPQQ